MQQTGYNKLNLVSLGLIVFCTIIAALVLIFFLAPMMQFGGGPFGYGAPPTIPDDVYEDIKKEIEMKESVIIFKETFPEYRESSEQEYGVDYRIQARNSITGNVLSLSINYHPMGPPGSSDKFRDNEHLECIPGEAVLGEHDYPPFYPPFMGGADLFIHETIKETNCLDDNWKPAVREGNH